MITLRIEDMTCGGCAGRIARAIAGLDPEARVVVDVASRLVRVTTTAPAAELVDEIGEAGYTAVPVAAPTAVAPRAGGCCCS